MTWSGPLVGSWLGEYHPNNITFANIYKIFTQQVASIKKSVDISKHMRHLRSMPSGIVDNQGVQNMTVIKHQMGSITVETVNVDSRPVYTVKVDGEKISHQVGYSACKLMDRRTVEFYLEDLTNHADFERAVCYILGSEHMFAHDLIERANNYLDRKAA